jgi:putative pyruvate formate lyase activating enzyme
MAGDKIHVARASLHMWEEPCISGEKGSGTVFFSGCSLRCVYCQNYKISREMTGKEMTIDELSDVFLKLWQKGAENINLVTPTHYAYSIREALKKAKKSGLNIPIVYNTSGYELEKTIEETADVIDIYLTDFKYINEETAKKYSKAENYPSVAKKALAAMVKNAGKCIFDENGMMKKGVIVRHLLLPKHVNEAKAIVKYLYETYADDIYISLMKQFTPVGNLEKYGEIARKVTKREYERLIGYALDIGVKNAFIQEGDTAEESFIPQFEQNL